MADRDDRGYWFDDYGVNRSRKGESVDYSIDDDGLDIDYEAGSGYMRESARLFLHLDILIKLLENAGYTVTKGPIDDPPR